MFKKIVHWGGIVFGALIGGMHRAEQKLETDAPAIEHLLQEGMSVAQFIPGIGPQVTAALNLGIELVGAADKTLHYTDETFQQIKAQVEAALPPDAGVSVVLIPSELKADLQAWLANVKAQADVIKADAQAITGNNGAPAAAKAAKASS